MTEKEWIDTAQALWQLVPVGGREQIWDQWHRFRIFNGLIGMDWATPGVADHEVPILNEMAVRLVPDDRREEATLLAARLLAGLPEVTARLKARKKRAKRARKDDLTPRAGVTIPDETPAATVGTSPLD